MRRALVIAALTLAAAAPASLGLIGNASFGRDVPVRVPTSAILLDEQGSELQPTVKRTTRSTNTTPRHLVISTVIVSPTRATANHSATGIGTSTAPATTTTRAERGDDNGPRTTATARVEPGDDNGPRTTATARVEPGDDNGGDSNSPSASTRDDGRDGGSGKHGGKG